MRDITGILQFLMKKVAVKTPNFFTVSRNNDKS